MVHDLHAAIVDISLPFWSIAFEFLTISFDPRDVLQDWSIYDHLRTCIRLTACCCHRRSRSTAVTSAFNFITSLATSHTQARKAVASSSHQPYPKNITSMPSVDVVGNLYLLLPEMSGLGVFAWGKSPSGRSMQDPAEVFEFTTAPSKSNGLPG